LCEANDFQTGSFCYNNGNSLQPVIDAFLGFDHADQAGPCLVGQTRTAPVIQCTRGGGNHRMVIGFVNVEIEALTCANGRVIDSCPTAGGRGSVCSSRGGGSGN